MNVAVTHATRPYNQLARARAAERTASNILDATFELYSELPIEDVTLAKIAERAGVSIQTVIRRFGGKDEAIVAVAEREQNRIRQDRSPAIKGNAAAAVDALVAHYERDGELALKMLTESSHHPAIAEIAVAGRTIHTRWCAEVFAPWLSQLSPAMRKRRLAQLAAACDVQTWRFMRRDCALGVRQTREAILEMVECLIEAGR